MITSSTETKCTRRQAKDWSYKQKFRVTTNIGRMYDREAHILDHYTWMHIYCIITLNNLECYY